MSKSKVPDHLYGLEFKIDDRYSLMFEDSKTICVKDKQSYSSGGRIEIGHAKRYGAALLAAVAALEGEQPPCPVVVTNWEIDMKIKQAERLIDEAKRAITELDEAINRAKSGR